ncbi:hypothetical protein EBE87_21575 [Pseudoroseomonas wenyumeiae]|uniref:Uncharacterized protein n=1 Tax=Teichococcus wenyumeiae TaxID=2478470 RepID=A0A3A9JHP5_9PROT|nr:hypothetical protein [Pseudoroseomonas wenyumeiae]RKK03156.1 hypothetical protein D6Z83_16080 [Pseudoroseomonas wenyumeiae]RMI19210.1 hypothetical protein EBE87_21575 [Pseudoroseomonas wenyumeiae]
MTEADPVVIVPVMSRFASLQYTPFETRRTLRRRLRRFLPGRESLAPLPGQGMLPDVAMLQLLRSVGIASNDREVVAREIYENAAEDAPTQPSFDDLLRQGWIRTFLGRIVVSRDIRLTVRRSEATLPALACLVHRLYDVVVDVEKALAIEGGVGGAASRVAAGEVELREIGCRSPAWVAARLWEARPTDMTVAQALEWWLDRWDVLGRPNFALRDAWEEAVADEFRSNLFALLQNEGALCDWADIREQLAKEYSLAHGTPPAEALVALPIPPDTMVGRAGWCDNHTVEQMSSGRMEAFDQGWGVLRLLLIDAEARDHGPPSHPSTPDLLDFAARKPDLLEVVIFEAKYRPALVADLLVHPPMAALGCRIIANFEASHGTSDRDLEDADHGALRAKAFEDGLALLVHGLATGATPADEAAALLIHVYRDRYPRRPSDREASLSRPTLLAVAGLPKEKALEVARCLIHSLDASGPDAPAFVATLELVATADLAADVDGDTILSNYVAAVRRRDTRLSADRLSTEAAAVLVSLGRRSQVWKVQDVLLPLDVRQASAELPSEETLLAKDGIAHAIRAVIRVLAGAIRAAGRGVSEDIVLALAEAIRSGSRDDVAEGRIDAFAPVSSTLGYGHRPRPIATDVARALAALGEDRRQPLRNAFAEVAEPAFLAELLSLVPASERGLLVRRLDELDPSRSPEVYTLTAVQQRIEALLRAGLPGPAQAFLDQEREVRTLGPVPGRARIRFTFELWSSLLRKEWTTIYQAKVPEDITEEERRACRETLEFYRGLAQIQAPDAIAGSAAATFEDLRRRHPQVSSYVLNLFAARMRDFLVGDTMQIVPLDRRAEGHRVLQSAETSFRALATPSAADREAFEANAGVLLLALDRPEEAAKRLAGLPPEHEQGRTAAFLAVALSRSGLAEQAHGVLDEAERTVGRNEAIAAAWANISTGAAYAGDPFVSRDQDPTTRLKAAFHEIVGLGAAEQAKVLSLSTERALARFLTRHVCAAAADVTSLVSAMEEVRVRNGEDDVTMLLGRLLQARLEAFGWSVPDQSKGGFTPRGNPGERDLVIRRGGVTVATIEAVIARNYVPRSDLTKHFQKLLGYADCQVFFHVSYAWHPNPDTIVDALREIAQTKAPAGHLFQGVEKLRRDGDLPRGFVARYRILDDEILVIFLVLDLGQQRMRDAVGVRTAP